MTKLVLLTGATGFIGRQILVNLIELGYIVRVVSRPGKIGIFSGLSNIEKVCVTDDLFNETKDWYTNALNGVQLVIHSAWYAEPGKYLESPLNEVCSKGTLRLAKLCKINSVKKFVGIGTCFEYDLNGQQQTIETHLNPLSPYAKSKVDTFLGLKELFLNDGIEFSWCRIFYLYGEGEDSRRLVPSIRKKLSSGQVVELGEPDVVRDFLDVRLAGKIIANIAVDEPSGVFNICSGIPVTLRDFCEHIAKDYGRLDLLKFGSKSFDQAIPKRVVGVKNFTFNI